MILYHSLKNSKALNTFFFSFHLKRSFSIWHERIEVQRPCLTKIVATVGPASEQLNILQDMVNHGLRVMRVNCSHSNFSEFESRFGNLRKTQGIHGTKFNLRAILLDTQGPEIRIGSFDPSLPNREVTLKKDDHITITTDESFRNKMTSKILFVTYKNIHNVISPSNVILLDDGLITLKIISIDKDKGCIECIISNTAILGDKKGVNLPGCKIDIPALSEKRSPGYRIWYRT